MVTPLRFINPHKLRTRRTSSVGKSLQLLHPVGEIPSKGFPTLNAGDFDLLELLVENYPLRVPLARESGELFLSLPACFFCFFPQGLRLPVK